MREWSCDLATAISLACQWEVVAAKPGNVHRSADFVDIGLMDFLHSGLALSNTARRWQAVWSDPATTSTPSFGQFIRDAVQATQQWTPSNTNLGICLLFGPLAEAWARPSAILPDAADANDPNLAIERRAVAHYLAASNPQPSRIAEPSVLESWRTRAKHLIDSASVAQTRFIYEAIALAKPGGLGTVPEADVAAASPLRDSDTVAHVMALAADRDSIAAEYVSGYALTFERTVPSLLGLLSSGCGLQWAIVGTYLRLLAENPDTLIARKVGWERARQISVWAGQLVDEFFPHDLQDWAKADREESCEQSLGDLDFALRSDANRLNPGTTADLIAAGLLVATLAGKISQPIRW